MNVYRINIWGPCQTESDVLARRSHGPDDTAVVFAPTNNIANQVCYLAATRAARGQSDYQEIDSFTQAVPSVLETGEDPFVFEPDVLDDLARDPVLPQLGFPDVQVGPGMLFFARCVQIAELTDRTGRTRGQFWVYAADERSANIVTTEHGEHLGLFDLDSEAIQVELYPMEQVCVFWNVGMVQYELHRDRLGSDEQ